jgi:hypothetical protein
MVVVVHLHFMPVVPEPQEQLLPPLYSVEMVEQVEMGQQDKTELRERLALEETITEDVMVV